MDKLILSKIWSDTVEANAIKEKTRRGDVVAIRAAFASTFYKENKVSLKTIGEVLGKDHATVLWSKRRVESGYFRNNPHFEKYKAYFKRVKGAVKNGVDIGMKSQSNDLEVFALKEENQKLKTAVYALKNRPSYATEHLVNLEEQIRKANGILGLSGSKKIDIELIKKIKELI